ncbi:hypothetical protein CTEN210_11411 [Chaetoceros tenuissimus]|uniref:Fatty acid hydroxylase domain-containing protein n=1 Tax=Chaetoceros tenuissimus TaxID=426638 RepID=A0AAD3H940_9STRA|nr:hypothetical protein CTEN210_11411 [Chaetoceros tenuissimus]
MANEIIESISFRCVVAANAFYWLISTIVLHIDSLVAKNKSPWLKQYKIKPNHYISGKERRDLIMLSAFNMLMVAPLISVPLFEILWDRVHGNFRLSENDTWVWEIELLQKIPIQILVTEVGFYTIHIIMHSSPLLYKHVHKIHHRFQAPTAMACVYAHPLEFLLGNLLPIYMGPILTNAHPFTSYFWFVVAMVGTCKGHSGYKIFGHADYHEEHHYYYKYNYGGMYILDFLFGTMRL